MDEYEEFLKKFMKNFDKGLNLANKKNGDKAAYIFLMVRDLEDLEGNIDIASPLTTKSIIKVLEVAHFMAHKDMVLKESQKD